MKQVFRNLKYLLALLTTPTSGPFPGLSFDCGFSDAPPSRVLNPFGDSGSSKPATAP